MPAFRKSQIIRRCVCGLALCCLLWPVIAQPAQAATDVTLSYVKNNAAVAFSVIDDESKLYDPAWLLDVSRVLATTEVDPQTVKLTGRGSAAVSFTSEPLFPQWTGSAAADKAASAIAAEAAKKATLAEQVQYIEAQLNEICQYDTAGVKNGVLTANRCAYGALVEGKATCEGFANAFLLICDELSIPCVKVLGYTAAGVYHTWNAVYDGQTWYMCDVLAARSNASYGYISESEYRKLTGLQSMNDAVYEDARSYVLGLPVAL